MSLILDGTNGVSDIDGSAATPAIRGTDTNTGIFFPAADTIAFSEGGTEVARFDSAGNLGIGTTSPAYKLDVNGTLTANGSQEVMRIAAADSGQAGGINIKSVYGNSASDRVTTILSVDGQGQDSPLAFGTGTSERMRIDSSGNLMVGKTTTSDTTIGCYIGPAGKIGLTSSASTNGTSTLDTYSTGAGNYRFYVGYGGTVFATSTTITAISDQRLKENITDIDVGLDALMALKPRKFDWKAGKGKDKKGDRGWIAQEFATVFPEMIDEWKDPAPEGEEPYKAVNADLIPVLVKAIQELKAELDSVKAELATLKGAA